MFGWASKGGHIAEADLSAYADGMTSRGLASRIEAHFATCSECATVLRELRATKSLLSRLPTPTTTRNFTLGPEFATATPTRRPAPSRGFLTFAPALTLSLLVVLLVVDLLPGGTKGSSDAAISSGGLSSEKAASAAAASGPPPSPAPLNQVYTAPADAAAPKAPVPAAPITGSGGAAPTPQPAITGRSSDSSTPPATPAAQAATALRSPTQTTEGFNPAAAGASGTPLVVSRPPLQSTAASAHGSGVSVLRILEILAAVGFVASLGAFVWDKKRP